MPKRWPLLLIRGAAAKKRREPLSPLTCAMSLDLRHPTVHGTPTIFEHQATCQSYCSMNVDMKVPIPAAESMPSQVHANIHRFEK